MLVTVFQQLDNWLTQENARRRKDGAMTLRQAVIMVVGQAALLEAKVELQLLATTDVDAYTQAEQATTKKLDELLGQHGRHLDPHSNEVWMPVETQYDPLFSGKLVKASLAQPDYVLVSKALKAPEKNKNLITEYLAKGASKRFEELAEKYEIDLEQFV